MANEEDRQQRRKHVQTAAIAVACTAWTVGCAHYLTKQRMDGLEEQMRKHITQTQETISELNLRLENALGDGSNTQKREVMVQEFRAALKDLEARLIERIETSERS